MKSPRIAIIGAGPAGLTLARILHLHGLHATVFEGEPCSAARSQGGSLDMHPESGQYAIECSGLTAEFNRIARYDDQESRVYDKYGTLRFVDTDISAGDRPEVDRGELRQMLRDSLPPNLIRWDHQLSAIHAHHDPGRQETFHLVFRNGETETFDLVVGADGAWSRVRPLLSDVWPVYSGVAFVELGIDDVDIRHPELARLVGHGLTFAVGDSRALIGHRDANAHIGIYAALRAPKDWIDIGGLDQSSPDALRSSLAAHFDSWSPDLLNLIYQAGDRITPRAIYALPVGHRWQHRPGVTLVGDAGHLMSPFGGDGANLAMQDAADLALALVSNKDWNTAVQSYETAMFPRAEQCAAGAKSSVDEVFSPVGLHHMLQEMESRHR